MLICIDKICQKVRSSYVYKNKKSDFYFFIVCIVMAQGMNAKEMYEICDNCERNDVRDVVNLCKTCVYDVLRTRLENQNKKQPDNADQNK